MERLLKFSFSFILIVIYLINYAKNSELSPSQADSLEQKLITSKNEQRADILNTLSTHFLQNDFHKSEKYAKESLTLSEKINYTKGVASAFSNLGHGLENQSKYKEALSYYRKALEVKNKMNDSSGKQSVLLDIANIHKMLGDYYWAKRYYEDALKISEQAGDDKNTGTIWNQMGNFHADHGDYELATENFIKAISFFEKAGYKKGKAYALGNLGIISFSQKNNEKAKEYFLPCLKTLEELNDVFGSIAILNNIGGVYLDMNDSKNALKYFNEALISAQKINNVKIEAAAHQNIGKVYFSNENNYSEALRHFETSLQLKQKTGDTRSCVFSLVALAAVHLKLGNLKKSLVYVENADSIAKELELKPLLPNIYKQYGETYSGMGNYQKAYRYQQLYSQVQDSLLGEQSVKKIAEMQTKYETEKKEKEIVLLQNEKVIQETSLEKRNFVIGMVAGILLLTLISSGLLLNRFITTKKQKQIIETQQLSLQEKNKDITDSINYAQSIQQAILPSQKFFKSHLNNSFVLYLPKDIVAGDFYWMEKVNEKILFAACDCTGHGVPGAFVSIVAHNSLNRAVKEFGLTKPSAVLDKINELVEETFSKSENQISDGMDIAFCALKMEDEKWNLEFAGANNSLYLIRAGSEQNMKHLQEIKANKQPIGKFSDRKSFTNHEIELKKGDTIYIFSDGYADQFGGPKGKKFKYSQFERLLLSIQQKSMSEQKEILLYELEKWKGNLTQIDDICIVGVGV